MRTDTVKEPTVVTDDHSTSGKVLQTFFEGTERIHVDVIGGLVQQQHITFLLQAERQMQAVAFTTGKHPTELFLVGTGEVKTGQIGACINVAPSHANQIVSAGNDLIYALVGVDILVLLVHVGNLYGLPHLEFAFVCLFQSHDKTEKRSLTGTVRADDTHDTVGWKHEVEVIEQQFVTERLCHMLGFNHLITQTGTVRDKDFQLLFLLLHILVQQFVVGVQTRLSLCLTGLGSHAHPLQLAFQRLAALAGGLFLLLHALGLLFQPTGVVTFPGNTFATVQLKNPAGNVVEEVTVVRYGNHRTLVLLQVLFQPVDGFGIKVVGGLVKKKHVGLLQQ